MGDESVCITQKAERKIVRKAKIGGVRDGLRVEWREVVIEKSGKMEEGGTSVRDTRKLKNLSVIKRLSGDSERRE